MAAPKGNKFAEGQDGPTKYKPEYDEQVYKLCLLGADDSEIADFFEVTEQTVNNWKKDHPSFFESLKNGKEIADMSIAESLYQRAIGATIKKQQAFKVKVDKFVEDIKIVDIEEQVPPDTTALIFWLKNRKTTKWRDKTEIDHSNKGEKFEPIDYSKLSDDVIRAILAANNNEKIKD